jgi:hypothetical protein
MVVGTSRVLTSLRQRPVVFSLSIMSSPPPSGNRIWLARPHSIAELAEDASASIHFSTRYSLNSWSRACDNLRKEAIAYQGMQGGEALERAFGFHVRIAKYVYARIESLTSDRRPKRKGGRRAVLTGPYDALSRTGSASSYFQLTLSIKILPLR